MRISTGFTGIRLLSVLLAVCLLAAMAPGVAAAQSGTGVIEITTAQQLFNIGRTTDEPLSGTYELMNNVDLSVYGQVYADFLQGYPSSTWTGWYPIGLGSGFTGKFYGDGHTISGLYIDDGNGNLPDAGLFGSIASGAVVDSVYLDNAFVKADGVGCYYGGLAGYDSGSVSSCYATGTVIGGVTNGSADFNGGLVGYNDSGASISACHAAVSIGGGYGPHNGGLAGENAGSLSNCYATGSVSGNSNGDGSWNGGLVGQNGGAISSCYATGAVGSDGSGAYDGGLVGENDTGGSISNSCYATGGVSGNGSGAYGGLVGQNGGAISNGCYAAGSVDSSGSDAYNGGLAGGNSGSISDCFYATGSVSSNGSGAHNGGLAGGNSGSISGCYAPAGSVSGTGSGAYNGGLAGQNTGTVSSSHTAGNFSGSGAYNGGLVGQNRGSISNCYTTGSVSASGTYNGGLVGQNTGASASISDCYATAGVSAVAGAVYNGGLVGENSGGDGNHWASISNCYATGSVSGSGTYNGGLVGQNSSEENYTVSATLNGGGGIGSCYATGSVSSSGSGAYDGGLVGKNNGFIANCYATGSVSSSGGGAYNGGLVGDNGQVSVADTQNAPNIVDCYATGSVGSVPGTVYGGLVGEQTNASGCANATVTNSYCVAAPGQSAIGQEYATYQSCQGPFGLPNNSDGSGMTTAELQQENTFTNTSTNWGSYGNPGATGWASWDFTNTWGVNEGYSYPYLLNVPPSPPPEVTAAASPGGAVNGQSSYTGSYNVADEVYLKAVPDNGYTFSDWTGGSSTVSSAVYTFAMPAANVNLTANFTANSAPTITAGPTNQTVTAGQTATFGVTAASNDGGTPSYQWRYSTNSGSTWSNVTTGTGGTSDSYTTGTLTTADSGTEYDCVVTDSVSNLTATSNAATLTVNPAASTPTGGGGGSFVPSPTDTSTGSAPVSPSAGATVGLGTAASVTIPAGALQGTSNATVSVQTSTSPPAAPSGFEVLGQTYRFTVNGQDHYNFNSNVTLTFTLPSNIPDGETPAVYYWDDTASPVQWIDLGGTVSGDTITVTVNHFTEYAVMVKTPVSPIPTSKEKFADVTGTWAQGAIDKLVCLGAITGYPDGTFRPDNDITRAEFVTVLVKALKLTPKIGPVFADTAGDWAQPYISTAAAHGIVSGYDANHFGPNDPITREQMTVMMVRAAKLAPVSGASTFRDATRMDAWARDNVLTAVRYGIIHGYPDGTFRPLDHATRAEAATVIAVLVK